MAPFKIPTDKPMQAAIPEDMDLLKWTGVINAEIGRAHV